MGRLVYLVVAAGCGRIGFDAIDEATPATCTTVEVADDFEDGAVSTQWFRYAEGNVGVVETGGQLEVTPVADQGGSLYGGYISQAVVDIRDRCIFVTLVATTVGEGEVETQMIVLLDAAATFGVSVERSQLEAFENFDGNITTIGLVPHDPVAHHIVRIREAGGTVFWETSADGHVFAHQFDAPAPFDVSAVQVLIQAGTFGSVSNPGTAVFDNFDVTE